MKFFACLIVLAAIACIVSADKHEKKEGLVGSSYGAPAGYGAPAPSYAAPPCPKSYLFSCQPNMAPVPCAAGGSSGGYGGAVGAYSEQVPQWVVPQWAAGVPQY